MQIPPYQSRYRSITFCRDNSSRSMGFSIHRYCDLFHNGIVSLRHYFSRLNAIFWIFFCLFSISLSAAELQVGTGQQYTTITKAIRAAQEGDTILVHPGKYSEGQIDIDKSLTLRGIDFPVVSGNKSDEVFFVTAPNVSITGFEIRDTGKGSLKDYSGIKVSETGGARIEKNRFRNCTFAIFLSRAKHCIVKDNDIQFADNKNDKKPAGGNGIHLWSCDHIEITHNTVRGQRDGIYLEFATDSVIDDNLVIDNSRYGLHFMFSHSNTCHRNALLKNGAGVALMYSKELKMSHNRFSQSWGGAAYGLLIKDMSRGTISHNIFEQNTIAITIDGSTKMTIEHNQLVGNGKAIRLHSNSSENIITKNNFSANSFDFIAPSGMRDNKLHGNYWDHYEGYDLKRDGVGDIPHRPVSLYSTIVDRVPPSILLLRSPIVHLLDQAEKVFPSITPESVVDEQPSMHPLSVDPTNLIPASDS